MILDDGQPSILQYGDFDYSQGISRGRSRGEVPSHCPKNPWRVHSAFTVTSGAAVNSGRITISPALNFIKAFRVTNLAIAAEAGVTITGGYDWGLSSTELSSQAKKAPYLVINALNTGVAVASEQSGLIGVASTASSTGFSQNIGTSTDFCDRNPKIFFAKEQRIQSFDWSIQSLSGGTFTPTLPYTLEFEIFFYDAECTCDGEL
jgi:hypothetical protein